MLLRRYNPRHTFMLAMDGPAPLAKLLTQRCDPIPLVPLAEALTEKRFSRLSSTKRLACYACLV